MPYLRAVDSDQLVAPHNLRAAAISNRIRHDVVNHHSVWIFGLSMPLKQQADRPRRRLRR